MSWARDITRASKLALSKPGYVGLFVASWFAVLTLFLLISRSSVLAYVLLSSQFDAAGKLSFLAQVYANFFFYVTAPIVFTAFAFTLLAALNITLLVYMARVMERRVSSKSSASAAAAVIASHVLSCGSSLLAPFFSALAGSSAYNDPGRLQVVAVFGVLLNMVGLVLILRSTAKVARHINDMPAADLPAHSDYLGDARIKVT